MIQASQAEKNRAATATKFKKEKEHGNTGPSKPDTKKKDNDN